MWMGIEANRELLHPEDGNFNGTLAVSRGDRLKS
jgi:hypothetical protein